MDIIVPGLYKEYGNYVNKSKMFPNILDGLLPVQRRTLLGAYMIAKSSFVKTVKVIGEVIGKWHPHAEQVGTFEWAVQNGFLEGSGWWGSKLGSQPSSCAAPRYTSVKLSSFPLQLGLNLVKYVKWEEDELDPEPIAFPTLLPYILICKYTQSFIGFGRKGTYPTYKISDLIKFIFDNNYIPVPRILGADCISRKNEIKKLLFENKSRIKLDFKVKTIVQDKFIYVISCPEYKLQTILKKLGKLWENQDVGYVEIRVPENIQKKLKLSKDETTCFRFEVAKQRNIQNIFSKIEKILSNLTFSIYYEIIAYDPDIENIRQISVSEFIESCKTFYKNTYQTYVSSEISRLNQILSEYKIIKKIQPHLGKFIDSRAFLETKIKQLSSLINVPEEDILNVVTKYRIKTLLTYKLDTTEIEKQIKQLKIDLQNIENIINDHIQKLNGKD